MCLCTHWYQQRARAGRPSHTLPKSALEQPAGEQTALEGPAASAADDMTGGSRSLLAVAGWLSP